MDIINKLKKQTNDEELTTITFQIEKSLKEALVKLLDDNGIKQIDFFKSVISEVLNKHNVYNG